jgi:hypothetical protein
MLDMKLRCARLALSETARIFRFWRVGAGVGCCGAGFGQDGFFGHVLFWLVFAAKAKMAPSKK